MYKELNFTGALGDSQKSIIKYNEDGSFTSFPADPSNTDYQAYLKWLEEGNLPSPADIVEPSPTASVEPLPADGE